MKTHIFKSLLFTVLGGIYAFHAYSATSLFSDYGQIQNVQNYSSNPFWSPNSPYNQRFPQPVYVQGVDVKTDECDKVVNSLVAVQCMARDNCKNTQLSEIRPEIMVQLSKLPGKNYVSSCAGYIDSAFESYVQQYGNELPNREVSFPKATQPTQNNTNTGIQFNNPYQRTAPKWQQEINERSNELKQLQQENGAGSEHLSATQFPSTYEDLSFKSKMELMNDSYEPYKDKSAYKIPDFQNKDKWCKGEGKGTEFCDPKNDPEKKTEALKKTGKKASTEAPYILRQDAEHQLVQTMDAIHDYSGDAERQHALHQPIQKQERQEHPQDTLNKHDITDTESLIAAITEINVDYALIEVLPETQESCYTPCTSNRTSNNVNDPFNTKLFNPQVYCVGGNIKGKFVSIIPAKDTGTTLSYTPAQFLPNQINTIETKISKQLLDSSCDKIVLKIHLYNKDGTLDFHNWSIE